MKVCPNGHLNEDAATQCEICDAPFPPAVVPLPPTPIGPMDVTEAAEVQRMKQELADALSKIAELQRLLAASGQSEKPLLLPEPSPTPSKGSVLGLSVVRLVQNWPKVTTGAASIIATLGAVFTAFHLGVGGLGAPPDHPATEKTTTPATNAGDPHIKQIEELNGQVSGAVKAREESDARASEFESQLAGAKKDLTTVTAARDGLKNQVSGLETQLAGSRQELATVTAARDQALGRATAQAQPRVQAKVEAPRMGSFDFAMPDVKNDAEFTKRWADVGGDQRSWPSGDCTVMPLIPIDGKDRPFPVYSSCTAERIIIRKPKGLNKDRVVRLIWQLK
jgi:hypothetical protein